MKYMVARFFQDYEDLAYRVYTTDTLQLIASNTGLTVATTSQGKVLGKSFEKRYADLLDRAPQETRTGEEIVLEVVTRCGLKVKP